MMVKNFLGYFSVFFPESSMFAFIVIEPISKLSFVLSKIRTILYISKGIAPFPIYSFKVHSKF